MVLRRDGGGQQLRRSWRERRNDAKEQFGHLQEWPGPVHVTATASTFIVHGKGMLTEDSIPLTVHLGNLESKALDSTIYT